jgi:hypothetical protein
MWAMRTAIIHYWPLNMCGAEKVVEALLRLLPEAEKLPVAIAADADGARKF